MTARLEPCTVRRLADDEVPRVAEVLALARLYQGDGYYLVAWQGEEPVGHAHLALTNPPELQDMFVLASQRRQGIGALLTAAVEREAKSLGFDRLRLQVSADEEVAQALYRKCGFVDIGLPPQRFRGTVEIRTGPIYVEDTLLTWEKRLELGR